MKLDKHSDAQSMPRRTAESLVTNFVLVTSKFVVASKNCLKVARKGFNFLSKVSNCLRLETSSKTSKKFSQIGRIDFCVGHKDIFARKKIYIDPDLRPLSALALLAGTGASLPSAVCLS